MLFDLNSEDASLQILDCIPENPLNRSDYLETPCTKVNLKMNLWAMAFVKINGQGFQLIPQDNLLPGGNIVNDTVQEILNEIQVRQHLQDIVLHMLYRLNIQPWTSKPRVKNHILPEFCGML